MNHSTYKSRENCLTNPTTIVTVAPTIGVTPSAASAVPQITASPETAEQEDNPLSAVSVSAAAPLLDPPHPEKFAKNK